MNKGVEVAEKRMRKMVRRRQDGFTAMEMVVVMAIIGVIIGIGSSIINSRVTQARITDAKVFFERTFVSAVTSCQIKHRNPADCTQTAGSTTSNIAKEGLLPTTAWEDQNWSSTYTSSSRTYTIAYPVPSNVAEDLAETMSNSRSDSIVSASASGSTVNVVVKVP